jgi:hypothetical protein
VRAWRGGSRKSESPPAAESPDLQQDRICVPHTFAETNVTHSRLITPGPDNDFVFAIVFHFTINANGEIVGWQNHVTFDACV